MAKIAYPDKQTAVDPNSPAANEVFTAANANEIKQSVNDLYDLTELIVDLTTTDYTSSTLNTAYPSVGIGQKVACPNLSVSGATLYLKVTSTVWYSIPLNHPSSRTFAVTLDSSGEYDFTLNNIREFPTVTIYDSSGNAAPYFYNNTTKKITNGIPSETITVTFI